MPCEPGDNGTFDTPDGPAFSSRLKYIQMYIDIIFCMQKVFFKRLFKYKSTDLLVQNFLMKPHDYIILKHFENVDLGILQPEDIHLYQKRQNNAGNKGK